MSGAQAPIVFCHGLFGWGEGELGGYPYFVCASRLAAKEGDSYPRFIFPATGPISSLHDQACELFYQLKGGRVDYGEEHSARFGHARYTRDYTGKALYPEWDEDHPLDFVAHSMGAPVVRMLQYLLAEGFFSGADGTAIRTSSRWIRSLSTVAGVHNGSTLTWILGAEEGTGLIKSDAWLLKTLACLIEQIAKLQSRHKKLGAWYDLKLDQWGISPDETIRGGLGKLFDLPEFAESEDWALYDLSPDAMKKWNGILVEYPGTRYLSYTVCVTRRFFGLTIPVPFAAHFFLVPFSLRIGRYRFVSEQWKGEKRKPWLANDGMCPTWSQDFPHEGRTPADEPTDGRWFVARRVRLADHAEVAMLPHPGRLSHGEKLYSRILQNILSSRKNV